MRTSIHDRFIKEIFSHPKQGAEILSLVLSEEERQAFDFKRLKILPSNFIDKASQERRMDLLFSVPFKDSNEWVKALFLIEHKSYPDPELIKQFLNYQTGIYQNTKSPVIPVFINQSQNKDWKGALEFQDYLHNFSKRLREFFGKNVLNFCLRVFNVQAVDTEKLPKSLTILPILYTLKHIRAFHKENFVKLFNMGRYLRRSVREVLIGKAVNYVCRYYPGFDFRQVKRIEQQTLKKEDSIMESFIDKAVQKSREQGMQQGMQQGVQQGQHQRNQEVVLNMLRENADMAFISKVTGLSVKEIKKFKKGS